MTSFNKVIQLGNLTRDPEVRYSPGGTAVASFSIAVNSRVKQADGSYKDKVDYFDVVAFGKQAENVSQYLHKGDPALIEGRLNQRRWDDKETGAKRSKIEINAQQVTFMPKSRREATGGDENRREPTRTGETRQGPTDGVPDNVKDAFPDAQEVPEPSVDEGDIPF